MQQVYQPVLVGANIERKKVLLGRDPGSHMRPFQADCWLVNDRHAPLDGCRLIVRLVRNGESFAGAELGLATVAADSVTLLGTVTVPLPPDLPVGLYDLELTIHQAALVVSQNSYPIEVVTIANG